jgi:hypothetical protein
VLGRELLLIVRLPARLKAATAGIATMPALERLDELRLESMMTREKITDGANERAIDETLAGTAPGIPDDALLPGQEMPERPSDEEVARIAKTLGAPTPEAEE